MGSYQVKGSGVMGISYLGQLNAAPSAFVSAISDLEVAWIDGQPRLYSATLAGSGGGYSVYDLTRRVAGVAYGRCRLFVNSSARTRRHTLTVIDGQTGIGGTLIATGLSPSGWASYQLTGNGAFGAALQTPLAFDPTASASFQTGGTTFAYLTPDGNGRPLAFTLSVPGRWHQFQRLKMPPLPSVDDMAIAQTSADSSSCDLCLRKFYHLLFNWT